jgi:hypothetical protein
MGRALPGSPARADGLPRGVERRTCPSTFQGTPPAGSALPPNRRTPPARGATAEGVRALDVNGPGVLPTGAVRSRVALARAFAGLRRYMGLEPALGSADAFMSGGGRQAPPPDPWPPLWLRGSTATWLPRPPGLARGRLQARAGGSAGGAKRRPPALVNRLLESSAEATAAVTSNRLAARAWAGAPRPPAADESPAACPSGHPGPGWRLASPDR